MDIEPDNCVPDELHLLMRITDVHLRNIIDALSKDQFARMTGGPADNLCLLVKAVQDCGCTFQAWTTKSGEFEYTSLPRNDKKNFYKTFPTSYTSAYTRKQGNLPLNYGDTLPICIGLLQKKKHWLQLRIVRR